jgi:hypothetical protein
LEPLESLLEFLRGQEPQLRTVTFIKLLGLSEVAVPMEASQFGGDVVPHPDTHNQCPLLAQSGHGARTDTCLILVLKRTSLDLRVVVMTS